MSDERPIVVAYCRHCDGIVAAHVVYADDVERRGRGLKKDIAEWVVDYRVVVVTTPVTMTGHALYCASHHDNAQVAYERVIGELKRCL